jgi:hypothetical protein
MSFCFYCLLSCFVGLDLLILWIVLLNLSSVAALEKLNHLALNGSEEERSAASKILCGASLTRGWNIQVHLCLVV